MAINEIEAQQVLLVRAIERAPDNAGLWSDDDAREATREAQQRVGAAAAFEEFLARRAEWAIDTIRARRPDLPLRFGPPRWLATARRLSVAGAFVFGLTATELFAGGHVNVVEWPIVAMIAWNALVYGWVIVAGIAGLLRRRRPAGYALELLARSQLPALARPGQAGRSPWTRRFRADLIATARPLTATRVAATLHASAIAVAAGAVASVYWRALGKDYRAVWESTLLSAENVHAIARIVLGPGEWLLEALSTSVRLPDLAHIASLQLRPGWQGEPAHTWIHLYAAAILVWIVAPRLLLTGVARWRERRLRRAFPLALNTGYFNTLRAVRSGKALDVLVVPFRHQFTLPARTALRAMLERILGRSVTVTLRPAVTMDGTDDWAGVLGDDRHVAVLLLFNLAATAEPDEHGRFVARMQRALGARTPLAVVVDAAPCADKSAQRIRERTAQWQSVLDAQRCEPLFMDLAQPDDTATAALESRLEPRA